MNYPLLAIDIGNTNVTLGIFSPELRGSWRLATNPASTSDEYGTKTLDLLRYSSLDKQKVKSVAIASVVPALTPVFEDAAQRYFQVRASVIGEELKISMPNLYENPREVGADRIVNAVAAYAIYGGPAIVVDFGTATTFDCVTKKGEYAGGIIVPGPRLSAESLSLHTAKLPKVSMAKPGRIVGKNTVESIQSGLYYGYISLVDGLLERLKGELGSEAKIVTTGGLAHLLCQDSKFIKKDRISPDLNLEGIRMIWEKNFKTKG